MIMKLLRALGGRKEPAVHPTVDYKGYAIRPTPRKAHGGWTTEGVISRELQGETRSEHFIRADVLMSEEAAADYSVTKAKKIIDEQGERLFKS